MDAQEIFDTVYAKLKAQGVASVSDNVNCRYRGTNGTKCAVGHLIPDENYRPEMEGCGVLHPVVSDTLPFKVDKKISTLLAGLQGAHDSALRHEGLDAWQEEMRRIAKFHNLKFPENV